VDLRHPLAKTKSTDTRFCKRVFLPEEEAAFLSYRDPDALLWALWTGKEAAYKAAQKERMAVPAIPRLYKIVFEQESGSDREGTAHTHERRLLGTVHTPVGRMRLETLLTPDYVHTIALTDLEDRGNKAVWEVERLPVADALAPEDESSSVRKSLIGRLARYLLAPPEDIEIRRGPGRQGLGPPHVYFRRQSTAIDISLSHDGAFAAYAFLPSL